MNFVETLIKKFYGKPLPKNFRFKVGDNTFILTKITEDAIFYTIPDGREVSIQASSSFTLDIIEVALTGNSLLHGPGFFLKVDLR